MSSFFTSFSLPYTNAVMNVPLQLIEQWVQFGVARILFANDFPPLMV
ncbi:hypothetical protein J4S50_004321 [Salmonella enterica]|nr:hypothetical protein [Salmonella enterica]HDC0617716.1 hypothetical protein [Salmonella enterica]